MDSRRAWHIRDAAPEDARAAAALYAASPSLFDAPKTESGFLRLIQTGDRFLVAEGESGPAGAIRLREDDGVAFFDLLVARVPGAGPALLKAAEQRMQDRGIRIARMEVAQESRLPRAFGWFGYLPVATRVDGDAALVVLEKRLPLLTVREQRRSDAQEIGRIAGIDPWPFEQRPMPGWFVLADGERIRGVVSVRIAADGVAAIEPPALDDGYWGRGLEVWMLERAAAYAASGGGRTATTPDSNVPAESRLLLEERGWERQGNMWVKRLDVPSEVNIRENW